MDINLNLNISQEQKMVLTQQMKLSIDILQFSSLELNEFISEKIQENPLLEKKDEGNKELFDFLKKIKEDRRGERGKINTDEYISPISFVSKEENIYGFLSEQLRGTYCTELEREVIEYMIDNINDKGYLKVEDNHIKEVFDINEDQFCRCLEVLQGFDPVGIGARDIKECLILQLRRKGIKGEVVYSIIRENLDLIAKNKFKDIAKIYGLKISEAQEFGDVIKALEPKPTRGMNTGEKIVYVTPDVYVRNVEGELVVTLNEWNSPKLHINNLYVNISEDINAKDSEKKYVKEKINEAVNIMKSIDQRKSTLLKVMESIVQRQREYFFKGEMFIKPMILKDIAEELNLHESTVSRTIKNKYVECNNGVVAIKSLFTSKLSSTVSGGESSSKSIKSVIKSIIDGENKKKPLSDNSISGILEKEGIKISRRTVAKYREEMGILSTSKRKRF